MKHLNVAFSQYGQKEIAGIEDNKEIVKYFTQIGFDGEKLKDETAWCSAFANWVCLMADLPRSRALNARSWLNVGYHVDTPQIGDVVVFWRESRDSWKGHVAFFINKVGDQVYVLGGNQNNMVCIAPYNEIQVLDYRRL